MLLALLALMGSDSIFAECQPQLTVTDNENRNWKLGVNWSDKDKVPFKLEDSSSGIRFDCELSKWGTPPNANTRLGVRCVTASKDSFLVIFPSPAEQPNSEFLKQTSFFFGQAPYAQDRFLGKIACK